MRGTHIRDRLVPGAPTGDRLIGSVVGGVARHVHGRHVRRFASAGKDRKPGAAPAGCVRTTRGAHRHLRRGAHRSHAARIPVVYRR